MARQTVSGRPGGCSCPRVSRVTVWRVGGTDGFGPLCLCSPFPVPAQKPPLLRVLPLPASGRTPTTSLCQVELLIYIYLTTWKIFFSPYKVQPATVNFWVCLVIFSESSEKWEAGAGGGHCFPCEIPLFWPPEFPEIFIYLHVQKSQLFILFIIGCACKWRRLQLKWGFSHIQEDCLWLWWLPGNTSCPLGTVLGIHDSAWRGGSAACLAHRCFFCCCC